MNATNSELLDTLELRTLNRYDSSWNQLRYGWVVFGPAMSKTVASPWNVKTVPANVGGLVST